ncbi:MAG TPA: hypothetical protein PL037_02730, partial [Elusimicrobiales bacterium]|nr:hypothetical protein [Elusimicrobiales bacterium]
DGSLGINSETSSSFIFNMSYSGTAYDRVIFRADGNVGISTTSPEGRLDVKALNTSPTTMAQIWRNSNGVIQASMSATGVMKANYFIGNGSLLTNLNVSGIAGTPALTFGTANSAGSASTLVRTDATIAIFNDGATPDPLGTAAAGTDAYAARRDHVHALPFNSANQVLGTNSAGTDGEHKTLSVGSSGTDFAIAHAANSITFNLPSASASNRGVVTTAAQTFAGDKTFSSGTVYVGTVTFNNAGANRMYFGSTGVAAPGANSAGQKIQIYGTAGTVGASDYAIGVESNYMWFNSNSGYKYYSDAGSGSQVMQVVPGASYISFYAGASEIMRMYP